MLSEEPHEVQNVRVAIEVMLFCGLLPCNVRAVVGILAQTMKGAPETFWHIVQWQADISEGKTELWNRTAEQLQLPLRTGALSVIVVTL